ncbi:hypothetical protein LINGRAHAP2_LOCUS21097 [Linum grandiflorum]
MRLPLSRSSIIIVFLLLLLLLLFAFNCMLSLYGYLCIYYLLSTLSKFYVDSHNPLS